MDFNFDDMMSKYINKAAIELLANMAPDAETRDIFKKCLTIFVDHGIRVNDAMAILVDLSKVVAPAEPKEPEVSDISIDSQRMAYSILHNAYSQTKATKDQLIGYMCKARNVLNSKNKKEKAALLILNLALQKSKITKKELRDAIKEAAEELCK
jgi:hypothetical protein